MAHSADRNLLFGILALQMDFISRDALIAAMNAWLLQKDRPLAALLEEGGALEPAACAVLEPLVRHHIEQHGGDPARSLASLSSVDWIRADLAPIGEADPEVQHSLARLALATAAPGDDPEATAAYPGPAGSGGTRFRILRFHARGGLGEVFVAHDAELHREVALKQIQDRHADHPESRAAVRARGRDHRRAGAPGHRAGLRAGPLRRRPAVLRHAVHQGRQPQGGDRAVPRPTSDRAATRASGRCELRKLLRRFLDVCNAIAYAHSRGVLAPRPEAGQHHARPVRRDAGGRLGAGQGRSARPEGVGCEATLAARRRPAARARRCRARRSARRPT